MNEQMKNFYDQVGLDFENFQRVTVTKGDMEKFAELIVRECAQHALDFNNNIQHLPDKVMRGNLDRVQDYIKDRMGVEL